MWKCKLLGVYYTLRYGMDMLLQGQFLLGHNFVYTGEVHYDHWEMECTRCGTTAGTDERPPIDNENSKA